MSKKETKEDFVSMFTDIEIEKHYHETLRRIKDGMRPVVLNFHYHCALLHNDPDQAAGIKKAMQESNIPVSEKIVTPKKITIIENEINHS